MYLQGIVSHTDILNPVENVVEDIVCRLNLIPNNVKHYVKRVDTQHTYTTTNFHHQSCLFAKDFGNHNNQNYIQRYMQMGDVA